MYIGRSSQISEDTLANPSETNRKKTGSRVAKYLQKENCPDESRQFGLRRGRLFVFEQYPQQYWMVLQILNVQTQLHFVLYSALTGCRK